MAKRLREENEQPREERQITTGCMTGVFYAFCVIGVSLALAVFGWNSAKDVLGLLKDERVALIEVPEDFNIQQIAKTLGDNGIIEYPWLFSFYAGFSNAAEKIKPGRYELRSTLDYPAIVYNMREAATTREEIRVSIPEGYTLSQIIDLLDERGVSTKELLWETAENHKFEYSFLENVPMTKTRLEGYLFPDTYDFFIRERPIAVFGKLLSNFNRKLTREMRERAEQTGYSISEILTVASLVEREAGNDEERGNVASVIYNRLNSRGFPFLQIDATIQYILPAPKPVLSEEDLNIDSPYNTRLYSGLPPGPIANPGLNSIRAALWPDETDYYFYVLTPNGHQFCKTEAEFNRVKAANQDFLNSLGQ
ncbi:MAG: endolytic transglycosylase MltG [Oscillospiraceae bacterium]|nr:endolytic transglycosylase MltG [Oscillospiraceae bacterium]